jgi:hypothetical protein
MGLLTQSQRAGRRHIFTRAHRYREVDAETLFHFRRKRSNESHTSAQCHHSLYEPWKFPESTPYRLRRSPLFSCLTIVNELGKAMFPTARASTQRRSRDQKAWKERERAQQISSSRITTHTMSRDTALRCHASCSALCAWKANPQCPSRRTAGAVRRVM